jgi:hypothetical protein
MLKGSVLSVYGSGSLPPLGYSLALLGSYGDKPLTLENASTHSELGSLTGSTGTFTFLGAVGLGSGIDLGVSIPMHRVAASSGLGVGAPAAVNELRVTSSQLVLGDVRLVPRWTLLARERDVGLGVAVLAQLYLPTGDNSVYAGESLRLEPRVALDYRGKAGWLLALNLGYMFRGRTTLLDQRIDDALRLGVGTSIPITQSISGLLEVGMQINLMTQDFSRADLPTEGFLGLRYQGLGWSAQLGGGPGLVRGLATPNFRLLGAVAFAFEPKVKAEAEEIDSCEQQPERCE